MKGPHQAKDSLLVVVLAAMFLSIVAVVCVSAYAEDGVRKPAPRPSPPVEGVAPAAPSMEGVTGTHEAGAPAIDVKRDKEKTVYTIGPGDRRYEMEERDRAWDMLRNMTPIVDERHRRLPQSPSPKPAR